MYIIKYLLTLFIVATLTACGGDKTTKEDSTSPTEVGLIISATTSSEIFLDDNNIQLIASAESVVTDTSFTFTKANSDDSTVSSDSYTFSPSSLNFNKPVTLKIKVTAALQNQAYSIVRLNDGQWQPISSSLTADNFVTAEITSFGTFAIQARDLPPLSKVIGEQCNSDTQQQTVRFIHVADLHARFGFKEQLFSRIRSYYDNAKQENPYTLFTNGGDDYEKGTVAEQTSQGQATVEAIKAMAFDLRVIGNHDYAWGPEQLLNFAEDDNAIVLASNTSYEGENPEDFNGVTFSLVQVGCLRIGFFGMTSVPWNELDEPIEDEPIPDFIANFKMNWQWQSVAQEIINQYRQDVDFMVMISHLGEGTDTRIATNVEGIDLVLGGHTHGGESYQTLDNGSIVIQPNFFAQGLTDLTLTFNVANKELNNVDYKTIATNQINTIDSQTKSAIDEIMGRYAPDAQTEIAVSENYPDAKQLATITAKAILQQHSNIDAALLDPSLVQERWLPGTLTQEDFHAAFKVERQPSNTSGFNAIYQVSVTGSQLKSMVAEKPDWAYVAPSSVEDDNIYQVALFKGVALNSQLFFPSLTNLEAALVAESWWLLDNYARFRTSQCLYIDSDTTLDACKVDNAVSIWNFDNAEQGLNADSGPATLAFYDPQQSNWAESDTQFSTTTSLAIPDIDNTASGVLAFSRHSPSQGLLLTTHSQANGDFASSGLLADYTLVMDLLWPDESTNEWRALLQTDLTNSTDADLYVNRDNGIGIATADSGYFAALPANSWHRLAFVFYAAPNNGALKIYLDGELIGVKDEGEINQRWALDAAAILLSDNDYETKPGYLNALLFAGRAMTDAEIASMGSAQAKLTFVQPVRQLNQVVERHYQAAPQILANPWLQQRSKFFNKQDE